MIHEDAFVDMEYDGSIYISGPMRGINDNNAATFNRAFKLISAKYPNAVIHNPVEYGNPQLPFSDNFREDLARIVGCDKMVMLPGWGGSDGAMLEHQIANALDMEVEYMCVMCAEGTHGV